MKILHGVCNENFGTRLRGASSTEILILIKREAKASADKIHYYYPYDVLDGLLLDI
jgi:hypothetical protein